MKPDRWKLNLYICSMGSFINIVAMSLILPFLPEYIQELGVPAGQSVVHWTGFVYAATFFTAALTAPIWGKFADRYGPKLNLVRAGIGMTVAMTLVGLAQSVEQLLLCRLLVGLAGGYTSGASVLVAKQSPKEHSGWALGILSSSMTLGSLLGPLLGGILPFFIGMRGAIILTGLLIFVNVVLTVVVVVDDSQRSPATGARAAKTSRSMEGISSGASFAVLSLLAISFFVAFSRTAMEPMVPLHISGLSSIVFPAPGTVQGAGIALAALALGGVLGAPIIGRIADRIGKEKVLICSILTSAVLLFLQGVADEFWVLVFCRFLAGLALSGISPCLTALLKARADERVLGQTLGYSTSLQYAGQVSGPVTVAFISAAYGTAIGFFSAALVMIIAGLINSRSRLPER